MNASRVAPLLVVSLFASSAAGESRFPNEPIRPNVVLIVCDDLNDWVGILGGHPQAHTPHIDAFAETAVSFENAMCSTPVCAPSRASFLTGIEPHTSGNLFWSPWFENEVLANSKTMMQHFRDNGYRVVGAGKLMHHQRKDEWDEMPMLADYGPLVVEDGQTVAHPDVAEPFASIGAIDGSFGPIDDRAEWVLGRKRWAAGVGTRVPFTPGEATPDERVASWAVRRLERFAAASDSQHETGPFFIGIGFIRPHTPMHAPSEYFERFPLDDVALPPMLENDAADTHYADHFTPEVKGRRYRRLIAQSYGSSEEGLRRFAQAYLASTAFVDDQIGRVLDAIDGSPFADNTVVIITSDHGFGIGPKSFLFKNALWEESVRVPLLVRAPGVSSAGARVHQPVSLIDLYPTLVDLCGLPSDTRKNDRGHPLDGFSLRPLLEDPSAGKWSGPEAALTMLHADEGAHQPLTEADYNDPTRQHWSLRGVRWRYIRYNDGAEELYDHDTDPDEWHNVATDAQHRATLSRFRAILAERVGVDAAREP